MSGYQFFHIETYARIPSRTGKKQSVIGLVREAERHPNACLHIESPKKPTQLFGKHPSIVADDIIKLSEQALDSKGRKLRTDAQVLLAGVASYPIQCEQVTLDCPKLQKWLTLNLAFLKAEYGNALKSVILHLDENYPHIHFYCHPDLDGESKLNIRDIHCGMKLRDSVPDKGIGSGKLRSRLYKQAMRDQQDRYHQQVGVECGLARIGPKTRKLTRKEWVYEQQNAKRQQALLELEKANVQKLKDIELKQSKSLELVRKNTQVLKLIEQENLEKASIPQGFFSASKHKLHYLKGKLEQSVSRETKLKNKVLAEKEKVKTLELDKKRISSKLSKQEQKIESLENKVSNLIVKIDALTQGIKSWKNKYYQFIASINLKGKPTTNKNNNYEGSYDV
ncbi:MAG: plasmid recombination protein [Paraglaciecola sp.]|uniref:plasmid recombination protein n=1 Tax=Paraglaciecola sp. TaxID=1920173 RepID=UPI0032981039